VIVGAKEDHTVPASLARAQDEKYERSPAKTDFVEFGGRPRLFMVSEGCEEVAGEIDKWLAGVLVSSEAPAPASA
jgi:hypothetical protein